MQFDAIIVYYTKKTALAHTNKTI